MIGIPKIPPSCHFTHTRAQAGSGIAITSHELQTVASNTALQNFTTKPTNSDAQIASTLNTNATAKKGITRNTTTTNISTINISTNNVSVASLTIVKPSNDNITFADEQLIKHAPFWAWDLDISPSFSPTLWLLRDHHAFRYKKFAIDAFSFCY